ncbi:hypothetical protein CON64_09440 [Bacillus pseudomycoides]|nr:hypothetical protein CON64_09440 [Bacillus pseudomycoides]
MNTQRAKETVASSVMANVTYNGIQIYIQNVDENNETTRIYPLNELNNEQEIPLSSLIEYELLKCFLDKNSCRKNFDSCFFMVSNPIH